MSQKKVLIMKEIKCDPLLDISFRGIKGFLGCIAANIFLIYLTNSNFYYTFLLIVWHERFLFAFLIVKYVLLI